MALEAALEMLSVKQCLSGVKLLLTCEEAMTSNVTPGCIKEHQCAALEIPLHTSLNLLFLAQGNVYYTILYYS